MKRHYSPLTEFEKSQINRLYSNGESITEIANMLNRNRTTVSYYLKKVESSECTYKKTGRPPKVNDQLISKILDPVLKDRHLSLRDAKSLLTTPRQNSREYQLSFSPEQEPISPLTLQDPYPICDPPIIESISYETVRKIWHNSGLRYLKPCAMPNLTESQITQRYDFALSVLNGISTTGTLPPIVFTDESMFTRDLSTGKIWRMRGEIIENEKNIHEKYSLSVMVWGGIAFGTKTPLIRIDGSLNSEKYVRMIIENGVPQFLENRFGKNYLFMQDGASCHRSKFTTNVLISHMPILSKWPKNSPDLNPIEMVWGIIKKKIKGRSFGDKDELFLACQQEWNNIPISTINRLVQSFIPRLKVCAELKGKCLNGHWGQVKKVQDATI